MEEATKLRESATDVQEALGEIEGYVQRLRDLAIEVSIEKKPFVVTISRDLKG